MSRPESVSSMIASSGRRIAICRISTRFFSPPENPSFRYREVMERSIFSISMFSWSSFRNSGMRIGFSSPSSERRCAFTAIRRKLATVTPGIADGYWNARNIPSRERSSGSSSSTSVALERHLTRRSPRMPDGP